MENKFQEQNSLILQSQTRYSNSTVKKFSILPDLATGWRPKSLIIPPPILIKYKEKFISYLLCNLQSLNYKLVYLGPRHYNSFNFHNQVQHQYHVRFGLKNQQLPQTFQHQIQKYKRQQNRKFVGMNPRYQKHAKIQFDSNFQSGNLDMVIQINDNEYDLFLRPDTNTCGHTQWFYFKMKIKKFDHANSEKQTIKLNICNNRKFKTLYSKGMKPYIFSKKQNQKHKVGWHQNGQNVTYKKYINRYITKQKTQQTEAKNQFTSQYEQSKRDTANYFNQQLRYFCLSFQYVVEYEQDQVYFAYCPPYTYSQLRKDISLIKKKAHQEENCLLLEEKMCVSLSGLQVPILTITDSSIQDQHKQVVFSTARIHPGQSNSSYVMQGFLNFLVSSEARNLRKTCIFKIVPMINPDGVTLGNYRTGLAGKDLNRQFKVKNLQLLPQIFSLKEYIRKTKYQKKGNMLFYLDFHGHSSKKNVFIYGPQYEVWDLKFERCKILPKLLSCQTNMFKLNSCSFKIANYKKSTARAFMLGYAPYCYTVESSIGIYKQKNGQNIAFVIQKWKQMGINIGDVFLKSLERLNQYTFELMKKEKKKKRSSFSKNSLKQINVLLTSVQKSQDSLIAASQNDLVPEILSQSKQYPSLRQPFKSVSLQTIEQQKHHSQSMKNIQRKQKQITLQFPKIKQEKNESDDDNQNDDKSDCESQTNDFTKKQYELLSKDILKVIQDFKKVVDNKNSLVYKKVKVEKKRMKNKQLNTSSACVKNVLVRQSSTCKGGALKQLKGTPVPSLREMKLVPSLKHRLLKIEADERERAKLAKVDSSQKNKLIRIQKQKQNSCKQHMSPTSSTSNLKMKVKKSLVKNHSLFIIKPMV